VSGVCCVLCVVCGVLCVVCGVVWCCVVYCVCVLVCAGVLEILCWRFRDPKSAAKRQTKKRCYYHFCYVEVDKPPYGSLGFIPQLSKGASNFRDPYLI
jgi:hypothetical protein